jgi:hypothetical protein
MSGRIVVQALLLIAMAGCGGADSQEYTSPEGRFRAQYPGKPKLTQQTVPTQIGPIVLKIASTSDWSGTERFVSYADYPGGFIHPGNRDPMLDGACQGMATEARLVILSKMPISINGHPGREVSFEAQPGHPAGKISGRARVFVVGVRLYQVFIAGPTGRVTPETIDRFLNSFALLDQGPTPAAVPAGGPAPRVAPTPAARPAAARSPMGFYSIPDPATEAIVADTPFSDSGGVDRPGNPFPHDPATASDGVASAGGARIRRFEWIDENTEVVVGSGNAGKSDGTRDQHFRLSVELPQNTIVEELVVTSGGSHRWVTQPSDRDGPIAISQNGRPVARTYVAQVGLYSGAQNFDLYVNTAAGDGPGTAFEVQVVLSVAGHRITLNSQCRRRGQPARALADARPSGRMPNEPDQPAASSTPPATTPKPSQPAVSVRPPVSGRESTEVPTYLRPSAGGASIVSFDWIDQKDDRVGTSGRVFGPDGGHDEHYQLVLDLPPAATIEDIIITGGEELRWSTRPSTRFGPVAVFANQQAVNRGQSLRLGTFSGRWTFELYVESDGGIRPDHIFGAEVVLFIRGTRHHLTARCHRK